MPPTPNHRPTPAASKPVTGPIAERGLIKVAAFDRNGHRLGSGGGWYDRSFAFRHARQAPPHLVGAAFEVQQVVRLDNADWDVALDALGSLAAKAASGTATR